VLYKLLGVGGTDDVGFAGFRWQRPVHGEDAIHLLQSGEAHIKFEG
jgi:hypothetical protein